MHQSVDLEKFEALVFQFWHKDQPARPVCKHSVIPLAHAAFYIHPLTQANLHAAIIV